MLVVRRMKLEDCEQVAVIEAESFSIPWSLKSFQDTIKTAITKDSFPLYTKVKKTERRGLICPRRSIVFSVLFSRGENTVFLTNKRRCEASYSTYSRRKTPYRYGSVPAYSRDKQTYTFRTYSRCNVGRTVQSSRKSRYSSRIFISEHVHRIDKVAHRIH